MMNHTASIHNLELVRVAVERLAQRPAGEPGLAVLYGPSGYGKTTAACAVANEVRGYFVRMNSLWTRKTLLEKILLEMGVKATKGTAPELFDRAATELAASRRMLIIDEFDYCVRSDALIEMVRDLHDASGEAPILMIGEEMLPQKLMKWERFHRRASNNWIPAQPASLADAAAVAPIYCPGVEVREDMLAHLVKVARGSISRVCSNLRAVAEAASLEGWLVVDRAMWGERPLTTGEAPRRGV